MENREGVYRLAPVFHWTKDKHHRVLPPYIKVMHAYSGLGTWSCCSVNKKTPRVGDEQCDWSGDGQCGPREFTRIKKHVGPRGSALVQGVDCIRYLLSVPCRSGY